MALAKMLDGAEEIEGEEAAAGKKSLGGLLKLWSGKNGK